MYRIVHTGVINASTSILVFLICNLILTAGILLSKFIKLIAN